MYIPAPYSTVDNETNKILDGLSVRTARIVLDHINCTLDVDYVTGEKNAFNVSIANF